MEDNAVTALRLAGDEAVGFGLWSLVDAGRPGGQGGAADPGAGLDLVVDGDLRQDLPPRPPAPQAAGFERAFWSGAPLDDLYRRLGREADHPMAMLFAAAMEEWRDSAASARRRRRARCCSASSKVMALTLEREIEALERHLSSLATVGSTAPFVGLFGTVWGIMNSFQSIALTQEHHARGGRARHRRGAVRDRARPGRGDPGGDRLQQAVGRPRPLRRPACELRRRVHGGPVARARERSRRASTAAGRPEPWRSPTADAGRGAARGVAARADGGDQRHAVRRRDAGAADRVHGHGAAADGRRHRRPAARPPARRCPARTSR